MAIYMKYDGVTGNVTESGHTGWIELSSFRRGFHNSRASLVATRNMHPACNRD
jgi:type VI secretion system secreted protein Hcp